MNGRFEQRRAIGVFCADGARQPRRPRGAHDEHAERVRRADGQPVRHGAASALAPALIAYEWALKGLGQAGLDRGLRLLRVRGAAPGALQHQHPASSTSASFKGLPSPAAAALVTGFIWLMDDYGFKDGARVDWLAWTAVRRHAVCRPDDGHQRAVLQLQGHQLQALGAVHRDRRRSRWASRWSTSTRPLVLFAAVHASTALRGYAVYAVQALKGRPVSVISDVDGRARRAGACIADDRCVLHCRT